MEERGAEYRRLGEAGWRWVLDQVQWDGEGPWIPQNGGSSEPPEFRDEMHSGTAGLAYVLAEVALGRAWTDEEARLAAALADRFEHLAATQTEPSYFVGLVSTLGAQVALGHDPGPSADRLVALATPEGWPQQLVGEPRLRDGAVLNDATLGNAGVLLGALWAGRPDLAAIAADALLEAAEPTDHGLMWHLAPAAERRETSFAMPNFSHGTAGVAAALALAGVALDRTELVDAAVRGAQEVIALGSPEVEGLAVPHVVPEPPGYDEDELAWGWCHGPSGTSVLFAALERAGVDHVAGRTPEQWYGECLRAVRASGIPERRHPGFWDNDGRCCGTAGVADTFLDAWQRGGRREDLDFALVLADAIVEHAVVDGDRACWRFVEHRNEDPLLPPGVGWYQGAAGIAAYLLRLGRVLDEGRTAPALVRMENWWVVPETVREVGVSRPRRQG
ncbi:lanthionine synthetase LanC family protein [Nocardioides taihuensis]|uniref:Lanthionine synthetase LanC family protein n=1 Tax=Nocardioides taihuensis TaxID=1835606 RepID=A0ABW0BEQ7_9ACTN